MALNDNDEQTGVGGFTRIKMSKVLTFSITKLKEVILSQNMIFELNLQERYFKLVIKKNTFRIQSLKKFIYNLEIFYLFV